MPRKSSVKVFLPSYMELSPRADKNRLKIDISFRGKKEGSLYIAQGSVQWQPAKVSKYAHHSDWAKFIDLLEQMPTRPFNRL
jgi:hypothetical protein